MKKYINLIFLFVFPMTPVWGIVFDKHLRAAPSFLVKKPFNPWHGPYFGGVLDGERGASLMRFIMLGRGAKKYGWAYLHYEDHPCFWGEGTGLYVGYNFPLGQSLIFGMEAGGRTKRLVGRAVKREDAQNALQNLSSDIAIDDIDPLLVESLTGVGRVLESQLFLHESWEGGVQARLGYGMRRFLPYVAAGMAYARIEAGGLFHVLSDTGASIELGNAAHTHVNQWKIGYDVAVGADYALSNHIIVRGEYRYNDFGDLYLTMPYSTYQLSYRRHDFALGLFIYFRRRFGDDMPL